MRDWRKNGITGRRLRVKRARRVHSLTVVARSLEATRGVWCSPQKGGAGKRRAGGRPDCFEPGTCNSNTLHIDIVLDATLYIGARLRRCSHPVQDLRRFGMGQLSVDLSAKMEVLKAKTIIRTKAGVSFPRYFTSRLEPGKTPYDDVAWETRTASIGNDKGAVIFEQRDIEVPVDWSQTATNIVASKY